MGRKTRIRVKDFSMFSKRFERGMAVARALDRGEPLPFSRTVVEIDLAAFSKTLTEKRIALFDLVRRDRYSVTELADKTGRDPSAVRRDVELLESAGMVRTVRERNPGHGTRRVVRAAARRFWMEAA
ncbi:MAG: MarR family transcriptional regulator [Betaproteobacteria bacterium]|nr:MarR family transcriptional regulator [Betaproteobacteria bacterium]